MTCIDFCIPRHSVQPTSTPFIKHNKIYLPLVSHGAPASSFARCLGRGRHRRGLRRLGLLLCLGRRGVRLRGGRLRGGRLRGFESSDGGSFLGTRASASHCQGSRCHHSTRSSDAQATPVVHRLQGLTEVARKTGRRLKHKLVPRNAWRPELIEYFEFFMSCPKDEVPMSCISSMLFILGIFYV